MMGLKGGFGRCIEKRQHDLVMSSQADGSPTARPSRSLDHIQVRSVVLDHVHIDCCEFGDSIAKIPSHG
jgi:hypothetical protein